MGPPRRPAGVGAASVKFPSVPRPVGRQGLEDALDMWTGSDAVRELVKAFGGTVPDLEVNDRLRWLDDFSAVWDYRSGGRERDQQSRPELSAQQIDVTIAAAAALGLMDDAAAIVGHFDEVIILGGLVRACFNRVRITSQLLASEHVSTPSVSGLTAFRLLSGADGKTVPYPPSEVELAASMGFGHLRNEIDAMDAALQCYFDSGAPSLVRGVESDNTTAAWRVLTYPCRPPRLQVVAAPSSDPRRRADTADGLEFLASQVATLREGASVLVVTTSIYVPYQSSVAVRILALGHGASVVTVGVPALAPLRPDHYLAEIRSAIRGFRVLANAALAAG